MRKSAKLTELAKELNKAPVFDKTQGQRRNCIQHVQRMPRNKLQRIIKTKDQRQKEPGKTVKDKAGCVRPERK